jgi:hypothetical protein
VRVSVAENQSLQQGKRCRQVTNHPPSHPALQLRRVICFVEQTLDDAPSSQVPPLEQSCIPSLDVGLAVAAATHVEPPAEEPDECGICLDADMSLDITMLCCRRKFHISCVDQWLTSGAGRSNCPQCRRSIHFPQRVTANGSTPDETMLLNLLRDLMVPGDDEALVMGLREGGEGGGAPVLLMGGRGGRGRGGGRDGGRGGQGRGAQQYFLSAPPHESNDSDSSGPPDLVYSSGSSDESDDLPSLVTDTDSD